jgi:SAM-dependent methyltransferase
MSTFEEPFRSEFVELVQAGAASADVHDAAGDYSGVGPASAATLQREIERVALHQRSLCALLEREVGRVGNALDVGCSTGGTTVALALSGLCREIIGVDPNAFALEAAEKRARGYRVDATFQHVGAGARLPFASNRFELVTCISVLEFVADHDARAALVAEMVRVTKPGGHLAIFTPRRALFELHSGRVLGDFFKEPARPWASSARDLRSMLDGCSVRFLSGEQLEQIARSRGVPGAGVVRYVPGLGRLLPWQKVIARKAR